LNLELGTKEMRIAMLSPEIAPFAKTGGLADVVGTLALALERAGHEISLIMPAHRSVLRGYFSLDLSEPALSVAMGNAQVEATVLRSRLGSNISVFLVRADSYFDRDYLYGTAQADYPDNAERFIFFSRAALEVLRRHPADIVHAHDWQTALAVVFLKAQSERYPELALTKTVFTVHNLGFQGLFPAADWPLLNLDPGWFTPSGLEFYARINFLKGALRAEAKPGLADKCAGLMPHPVSNHRRFPLGMGGLETARYTKKDAYRRCITTGGPLARSLCVACEN
jgi:starch synthase